MQRPDDGNELLRVLPPGEVNRLQVVGNRIYVTGRFTHAGARPSPPLAVWAGAPSPLARGNPPALVMSARHPAARPGSAGCSPRRRR
ncbi:MAG: hypothetical protein ACKVYV_19360, partial [Limisphaerales bacterium]